MSEDGTTLVARTEDIGGGTYKTLFSATSNAICTRCSI